MTEIAKIEPGRSQTNESTAANADIADASPQQREAIVERLCQAVLLESNSPRVAESAGR